MNIWADLHLYSLILPVSGRDTQTKTHPPSHPHTQMHSETHPSPSIHSLGYKRTYTWLQKSWPMDFNEKMIDCKSQCPLICLLCLRQSIFELLRKGLRLFVPSTNVTSLTVCQLFRSVFKQRPLQHCSFSYKILTQLKSELYLIIVVYSKPLV